MLALAIGLMGFMFNSRQFLLYLSGLSIFYGFFVYYAVLWGSIVLISKAGLVVFGFKINDLSETFGLLLIFFAFSATIGWENPYVQYVTTGSFTGASTVFYGSEDGVLWTLWSGLMPNLPVESLWFLVFVFSPFIIALAGLYLVSGRVHMSPA